MRPVAMLPPTPVAATASPSAQARILADVLGSSAAVALTIGAPRPLVEEWLAGRRTPSVGARERIAGVLAVVAALRDGGRVAGHAVAWLTNRQPALGGDRPVHRLAAGDLAGVLAAVPPALTAVA